MVEAAGDYESINSVTAIGKEGYRVVVSAEVPDTPGSKPCEIKVARNVIAEDQRSARIMRNRYNVGSWSTPPTANR